MSVAGAATIEVVGTKIGVDLTGLVGVVLRDRSEGVGDLTAVAWVARSPAELVVVEGAEERETGADASFPRRDVDGPRKHADGVGLEVLLGPGLQDVVGIEWLVAAMVVHYIAPDFEYPEATNECFVDGSRREVVEVVEVTAERDASVASEFLCACFGFGDDGQGGKFEAVVTERTGVVAPRRRGVGGRTRRWLRCPVCRARHG